MNWISILVIALDQITKRAATYYFERNIFFSYLGFSNVLTCNKGISFSWLTSHRYYFLLKYLIIVFLFIITYLLFQTNDKLEQFALNLMLGGGVSNTLDRFLYNGVIDFIYYDPKIISPIIFNIADFMITFGTILLIVNSLVEYKKDKKNDKETQ